MKILYDVITYYVIINDVIGFYVTVNQWGIDFNPGPAVSSDG